MDPDYSLADWISYLGTLNFRLVMPALLDHNRGQITAGRLFWLRSHCAPFFGGNPSPKTQGLHRDP
jgi:hypothetical protein